MGNKWINIKNESANDILNKLDPIFYEENFESIGTAYKREDVSQVINYLSNIEKEQKWISVENRLPKYGTQILVYGIDNSMYGLKKIHVCEMDDLEDGMEFIESGIFYWLTENGAKIDNVTHWMPLPEPPINI